MMSSQKENIKNGLRGRIRRLQEKSSILNPDEKKRKQLLAATAAYSESFLHDIKNMPGYRIPVDEGRGVEAFPIGEKPMELAEILPILREHVDGFGVNPCSGSYLAYIPGSGLYASALADYLADVSNRYVGVYFASPAGVRIERQLIRWMAAFIGYPKNANGDLTSGGSIANLTGIVTAREAYSLKGKDLHRMVVYLTGQTHHSVEKALRIAGLAECVLRLIPLDSRFRLNTAILEETIISDKKRGLKPWLLVPTAGTTDTGAVDPLPEIADIASGHGLWMHTDAAYGAAFMLCDAGKTILKGLNRSDSLVMDPHKGLFIPFGSGAVLVKDGNLLRRAHRATADYLQDQDHLAAEDVVSPADVSPELSRPFRGLRLWLPLKLSGVAAFRAALEEKLLLARYFHEVISADSRFEVGPSPDLTIVTFRAIPPRGDQNDFNKKLIEAVQSDGRIFISSTTINGKFTLRLAVLGFRSHIDQVDLALTILTEKFKLLTE